MKKLSFLMIAAFVAMSSVFVSCEKEGGSVVVTFDKSEFDYGAAVTGKITSTNDLKSVTLLLNGTTTVTPGWPLEKFTAGNAVIDQKDGTYTIRLEGLDAGTYRLRATDSDGVEDAADFTVKEGEPVETPLKAGEDFILKYVNSSTAAPEHAATGVKFDAITNATTARFAVVATDGKFVMLADAAAYNAITTKEALKKAYDSKVAEGVASFTKESDGNFKTPVFFISKVADNYFLITMTKLTFAPGNNQAFFAYKF